MAMGARVTVCTLRAERRAAACEKLLRLSQVASALGEGSRGAIVATTVQVYTDDHPVCPSSAMEAE
jgi:hypothetical protein